LSSTPGTVRADVASERIESREVHEMLNYELIRAVHVDRERDVKRAVRERSLRAALAGSASPEQISERVPLDVVPATKLEPARPR
jgi:hypothetical protein